MGMVTDVAGKSFKAWSEFKTARAGELNAAPVDGAALDQGLAGEIRGEAGQQLNLDLSRAEHGPQSGLPDLIDDAGKVATTEQKVGGDSLAGEPSFNEEVPSLPAPAPGPGPAPAGGGGGAMGRFNTPGNWMRAIGIAISVALVIVMSVSLVQDWGKLNDTGRALSCLQVITTGLSVAIDAAIFRGEMLALDTVMYAQVLPFVGQALAVIGLVVTVIMMALGITKKQDPPPTPLETFITATAKPLVGSWDPMPKPGLTYSAPATVSPGATTAFAISAENDSGADVVRTSIRVTVQGGSDPSCLFTDTTMADLGVLSAGGGGDLKDGEAAVVAVAAGPPVTALSGAVTHTSRGGDLVAWDSIVRGVADPVANQEGNLTLRGKDGARQGFIVSFGGIVNKAGSNIVQIIEVLTNGDSCRSTLLVTRK
jgi:hypothetical protein